LTATETGTVAPFTRRCTLAAEADAIASNSKHLIQIIMRQIYKKYIYIYEWMNKTMAGDEPRLLGVKQDEV
jgi:hypothetical protein